MDCFTGIGVHYRGKQSTTEHGKNCNNWNKDLPHPHSYHSPEYNWAGVGEHRFVLLEEHSWHFRLIVLLSAPCKFWISILESRAVDSSLKKIVDENLVMKP